MAISENAQRWLNQHGGGQHFQFESRGASRECIEEDIGNLHSLLSVFDIEKAEQLMEEANEAFATLDSLDDKPFLEVQDDISECYQIFNELLFAFEDEINEHVVEGLWFGCEEGGLYGFWENTDD